MKRILRTAIMILGLAGGAYFAGAGVPAADAAGLRAAVTAAEQLGLNDEPAAQFVVPKPVPAPRAGTTRPAPVKEWTVMVFMNGNNDLMPYVSYDLGQISSAGTTAAVNMVVEMGLANWNGKGSVTFRMLVKKGAPDKPNTVVYNSWANRDMGDYRNVVDFAQWAKRNFPAKRYLLVIENHGGGVDDAVMQKPAAAKGISYDHVSYNYIKTPQLRQMMKEIGKVDIFLMAACEMQMAEVGYEIRDYADIVVGSENTDHGFAFLYKEKLSALAKTPKASNAAIAAAFVEQHRKFYSGDTILNPLYGVPVPTTLMGHTLSAIKAASFNGLPARLNAWTAAVRAANEPAAIKYAVENVLRFGPMNSKTKLFNTYADLGHFVKLVSGRSRSSAVKAAEGELADYITNDLVIAQYGAKKTEFYDYANATGISIKMAMLFSKPIQEAVPGWDKLFLTKYQDLSLSRDSGWDEFLVWVQKTYNAASAAAAPARNTR